MLKIFATTITITGTIFLALEAFGKERIGRWENNIKLFAWKINDNIVSKTKYLISPPHGDTFIWTISIGLLVINILLISIDTKFLIFLILTSCIEIIPLLMLFTLLRTKISFDFSRTDIPSVFPFSPLRKVFLIILGILIAIAFLLFIPSALIFYLLLYFTTKFIRIIINFKENNNLGNIFMIVGLILSILGIILNSI